MRRRCVLTLPLVASSAAVVASIANASSAGSRGSGGAAPSTLPPELRTELPEARLHGSARLRFLGMTIYEARLWSAERPAPSRWDEQPLALELEYARALGGGPIAERSLSEMRRQGPLADAEAERWLGAMRRTFPDVDRGDRLTGVLLPGRGARFFHNGTLRGEVAEPQFARRFFGIWLAPETSEPGLRAQLLGTGP